MYGSNNVDATRPAVRASVKLFELGVRTPGSLFLGVRYAGIVDFRRFRTPSVPIFGILGNFRPTRNDEYVGLHCMFKILLGVT